MRKADPSRAWALRTVFFDLDGTLADTAPDLVFALNAVRAEEGVPPLPFERVRPVVSLGGRAMIKLAFELEPGDAAFGRVHARFLDLYRTNLARHTRLFPGMAEVLDAIEDRGLNWGVVTNKASWLTEPLLAELGLTTRAACVVSGDTTTRRKPHPEPLLYACERAGSTPAQCVYVGDSHNDVAAGREAGMRTLIALFGYIPVDTDPAEWGADASIEAPAHLLAWIDGDA